MSNDAPIRDHKAWLGYVQQDGLVVSPAALVDAQVVLDRNTLPMQERFLPFTKEVTDSDDNALIAIANFPKFTREFLGWPEDCIYGLDVTRPVPDGLTAALPDYGETLAPSFAFKDPRPKDSTQPWMLLVQSLSLATDLDARVAADERGWSASPTQRMERLLRETKVVISIVHVFRGFYEGRHILDGREVARISAFLFHAGGDNDPARLTANASKCFEGYKLGGQAFLFDDADPKANPLALLEQIRVSEPHSISLIWPFLGGDEFNHSPTFSHHRFAINFEMRTEQEATAYPALFNIVKERVRPERMESNREGHRKWWWRYAEVRPGLVAATKMLSKVFAISKTTKYITFGQLDAKIVFSEKLKVLPSESLGFFSCLQSRVHELWALFFGGTRGETADYVPTDCFETFPFPIGFETNVALEAAGQEYYEFRAALMVRNNQGLTETYNRFHNPEERSSDILKLRDLHAAMDAAVLTAYGWTDLIPKCICEFLLDYEDEEEDESEGKARKRRKPWRYRWPDEIRDEVLARLLKLNAERAEQEKLAGQAVAVQKPKRKKAAAKGPKVAKAQLALGISTPSVVEPKLPTEFRLAATQPLLYTTNLVVALLSEAGGSLAWSRLFDAFILATTPKLTQRLVPAEDATRVKAWAARWNEAKTEGLLIPSLNQLGAKNLTTTESNGERVFHLLDGPRPRATEDVAYDAWIALRIAATLTPGAVQVSLGPAKGREEAALWVSKLAVYKAWPPLKATLLRQVIELHRGLNILWARPSGSTNEAARLAGHGAGKTTFCRLIRYVLGEEPAGSKGFREGFRTKFPNGWVLAEVYVAGQRWLVGRSLSEGGYNPFAKLNGSLDDEFPESPSRIGFKEYEKAIDEAVFGGMKFRTLAESQKTLDWARLLPWLSRDQEAHFSGLLEWRREQDSDSDSPYVSADDKANLIRLVLGLVDAKEQELLAEFARKAEAHEQKVRDRPKLEFTVERERVTLEAKLGMKVEDPDAPLLQQEVVKKVTELRNESDQALASVKQNEEIDKLLAEVGQRRAEWGVANAMVEEYEEAVELDEARLRGVAPPPKRQKDPFRETLNGLGPFPGYCSHLMDKAWKAECPIAHERPKDDEITDATKRIAAEAKPTALAGLKAELERRRKLAAPKQLALQNAMGALTLARERHQSELKKMKAPAQEAARIEALLAS